MAMLVVGYFCVSDVYVRAVCCHGAVQEARVCTSAVVYIAPSHASSIVCGHITMTAPYPVRSVKLSMVKSDQY